MISTGCRCHSCCCSFVSGVAITISSYYYYEVDVYAVGLNAFCEQARDMLYLICLVDGYVMSEVC